MSRKTLEEQEAAAELLNDRWNRAEVVIDKIRELVGPGNYGSSKIPCPVDGCSGEVAFAVVYSSRNKSKQSIRARCSGVNCVSFME